MAFLFGNRMHVTRASGDGRNWSPTVVNIERMKGRRRRKAIVIGIVILLVLCFICSAGWTLTQGKVTTKPTITPTAPPAAKIAAPTAPAAIQPTPTPILARGMTPIQDNPMVLYRLDPLPTSASK